MDRPSSLVIRDVGRVASELMREQRLGEGSFWVREQRWGRVACLECPSPLRSPVHLFHLAVPKYILLR